MAYGIVLEFAEVTREHYDAVNDKLGIDVARGTGDWPAGILSNAAGPLGADGWVVAEVWESKAAHEAWITGRLGTALASVGVPAPARVTEGELVSYVTP